MKVRRLKCEGRVKVESRRPECEIRSPVPRMPPSHRRSYRTSGCKARISAFALRPSHFGLPATLT